MRTQIIEVTNGPQNWGKFLLGLFDTEKSHRSAVAAGPMPLLAQIGWETRLMLIWVLDLQTMEGAAFRFGGDAHADLEKHRIWVCPLFEPFLEWLYRQDEATVRSLELPQLVDLPDAPFAFAGHRRRGGAHEGVAFIRTASIEGTRGRKFEPLDDANPLVRDQMACAACQAAFKAGDAVTLIAVGPGDDAGARKDARDGRFYAAVAVPAHWACATGEE